MELFPYEPRRNQRVIMGTIQRTLEERSHFIFESGTGSGKTVSTLAATLEFALKHNKKIIYTTRTNSQQQQVLREMRAIYDQYQDPRLFAIGMQGRANMCLLARHDTEIKNGTSEELSKYCTNQKKLAQKSQHKGCHYYRNINTMKDTIDEAVEWCKKKIPTAEELIEYCENKHLCPYELNKQLINEAIVIVVPYIYIFEKSIRNMLFDWIGAAEDNLILIVDEAHNLPNYLRDLYSAQLSMWMLNSCVKEAEKFGDPSIAGGKTTVKTFCDILIEILTTLRDNYVYGILEGGIRNTTSYKEDAIIPSRELEDELLTRLNITSRTLIEITSDLLAYGEKIQEYRQNNGKLPRSYLHKLGLFLEFWTTLESNEYLKLIVDAGNGHNPRIEAYCLDPSVACGIIRQFHASIHMSGTLEPLEEYRDSLGLPETTELTSLPSPFSADHLRIYYTSDVSTRYDDLNRNDDMIQKIWNYIKGISNSFPCNTMVTFPSFNLINMFKKNQNFDEISSSLYIEQQEMNQAELMDLVTDFKKCSDRTDGATLFSVMGGRISEGMDFPAQQLEIAIIVGIPYPKPTARQRGLQDYYERKFHKGWEYTVNAPAARKLLQSIGRLIRDEKDRGVALILDRRAARFTRYIRELRHTDDPIRDTRFFLSKAHFTAEDPESPAQSDTHDHTSRMKVSL